MPFTIERYPAHLIDVLRLLDGRRVTIRPVLPQDAELHQDFVRGLSTASRHNRFMMAISELSPQLLRDLMNVDYRNHVALIAETFDDGREVEIGEARYVVDEHGNAEFAVAIADAWQGFGLGGTLLQRLECHAAAAGIRRMVGDVFATNEAMKQLALRAGYRLDPDADAGWILRIAKDIGGDREIPCANGRPRAELLVA
jgi:acetyltransferase